LHFQGQSKAIAEDIVNFIKRGANRWTLWHAIEMCNLC